MAAGRYILYAVGWKIFRGILALYENEHRPCYLLVFNNRDLIVNI